MASKRGSRIRAAVAASNDAADALTCPVCQEVFVDACTIVPCGHSACCHCLKTWFDGGNTRCPACTVAATDTVLSFALREATETIHGPEVAARRVALGLQQPARQRPHAIEPQLSTARVFQLLCQEMLDLLQMPFQFRRLLGLARGDAPPNAPMPGRLLLGIVPSFGLVLALYFPAAIVLYRRAAIVMTEWGLDVSIAKTTLTLSIVVAGLLLLLRMRRVLPAQPLPAGLGVQGDEQPAAAAPPQPPPPEGGPIHVGRAPAWFAIAKAVGLVWFILFVVFFLFFLGKFTPLSSPQVLSVVANAPAGQPMTFAMPDGSHATVTVPDGVLVGSPFFVHAPAASAAEPAVSKMIEWIQNEVPGMLLWVFIVTFLVGTLASGRTRAVAAHDALCPH